MMSQTMGTKSEDTAKVRTSKTNLVTHVEKAISCLSRRKGVAMTDILKFCKNETKYFDGSQVKARQRLKDILKMAEKLNIVKLVNGGKSYALDDGNIMTARCGKRRRVRRRSKSRGCRKKSRRRKKSRGGCSKRRSRRRSRRSRGCSKKRRIRRRSRRSRGCKRRSRRRSRKSRGCKRRSRRRSRKSRRCSKRRSRRRSRKNRGGCSKRRRSRRRSRNKRCREIHPIVAQHTSEQVEAHSTIT